MQVTPSSVSTAKFLAAQSWFCRHRSMDFRWCTAQVPSALKWSIASASMALVTARDTLNFFEAGSRQVGWEQEAFLLWVPSPKRLSAQAKSEQRQSRRKRSHRTAASQKMHEPRPQRQLWFAAACEASSRLRPMAHRRRRCNARRLPGRDGTIPGGNRAYVPATAAASAHAIQERQPA